MAGKIPKHAHGTIHLKLPTSSARLIMQGAMELYDGIVDKKSADPQALYYGRTCYGREEGTKNRRLMSS